MSLALPESLIRLINDKRIEPLTKRNKELEKENTDLKNRLENVKKFAGWKHIYICHFCEYYIKYDDILNTECRHDLEICKKCYSSLHGGWCSACARFNCPECSLKPCVHCSGKIDIKIG